MALIPKNRPKLKIPLTVMDKVSEAVSALVVFITTVLFLFRYQAIAAEIPMQYDLTGKVSRIGNRSELFLLLGIMIILYAGLTVLQRFPHIYNYLVEINENNAARQYSLAVRMMRWLKLMMVGLFSLLLLQSAFPEVISETLMLTGAVIFVIATFVQMIGYLYLQGKKE